MWGVGSGEGKLNVGSREGKLNVGSGEWSVYGKVVRSKMFSTKSAAGA